MSNIFNAFYNLYYGECDEPHARQVHLRHLLLKQIKNSKLILKRVDPKIVKRTNIKMVSQKKK